MLPCPMCYSYLIVFALSSTENISYCDLTSSEVTHSIVFSGAFQLHSCRWHPCVFVVSSNTIQNLQQDHNGLTKLPEQPFSALAQIADLRSAKRSLIRTLKKCFTNILFNKCMMSSVKSKLRTSIRPLHGATPS